MALPEIRTQVFHTAAQWESGLRYRLKLLPEGGISLQPMPSFQRWAITWGKPNMVPELNPVSIAVDPCEQIYFIDENRMRLYRYDPALQQLEKLPLIAGEGAYPGQLRYPGSMVFTTHHLWLLDRGNRRVQVFSRENWQLKYIISAGLARPRDMDLDGETYLYVLEETGGPLRQFDLNNPAQPAKAFGEKQIRGPVSLAVGKERRVYVLEAQGRGFQVFDDQGTYQGRAGNFRDVFQSDPPVDLSADRDGNLYVLTRSRRTIYQFDADGSFIGPVAIPDFSGTVNKLTVDQKGNLYAATADGIVMLSLGVHAAGREGFYYSPTLDNGLSDNQWHRLAVQGDLPPKTALAVCYYSTNSENIRTIVDHILTDDQTNVQEKALRMDEYLPWIGPEKISNGMIFRESGGRYLWLKLSLASFAEDQIPLLREMRLYYPRISYLRYLPAVYQEDPQSREFLERFLSIFETVFYDLEIRIEHLFQYIDPAIAPADLLSWLGCWLNIALEEDWRDAQKRQLLLSAARLFKQKGTAEGLATFLEIYTGKRPVIIEQARENPPWVLNGNTRLGLDTRVLNTPVRGFWLGHDAVLGRSAIREVAQNPDEPFRQLAHQFTLLLDLTRAEYLSRQTGIENILKEASPAHTRYRIRLIGDPRTRREFYLGVNSRVAEWVPFQLGESATVGVSILAAGGEPGVRIERNSVLGKGFELV